MKFFPTIQNKLHWNNDNTKFMDQILIFTRANSTLLNTHGSKIKSQEKLEYILVQVENENTTYLILIKYHMKSYNISGLCYKDT